MIADHEAAFLRAMSDAGLAMLKPALIGDGVLHRYRVEGDKAGSLNGWYVLHMDDKPFGAFGSWKTGQSCSWSAERREAMTPAERAKPEILKASRKRRIAAGAGVTVQEVNRLLSQFEQTQKMMKQFSKGGMQKMMRAMKGLMPGGGLR